jgi:hypothetical protein
MGNAIITLERKTAFWCEASRRFSDFIHAVLCILNTALASYSESKGSLNCFLSRKQELLDRT